MHNKCIAYHIVYMICIIYYWGRKWKPTPVSIFQSWEIPQTDNPGGLLSMGSQRVGHDLETKQQ